MTSRSSTLPPARQRAFAKTYHVPAQAVGPDSRLQLPGLLTYLHETAQAHARSVGYGFAELRERGLAWALVCLDLRIDHLPAGADELRVSTSVSRAAGPLAFRDYEARANGQLVCAGQGMWALISLETRRSTPPPPDLHRALHDNPPPVQTAVPRARRLPEADPLPVTTAPEVGYHDLDFNGHLNNVVAASWLLDAIYKVSTGSLHLDAVRLSYHQELLRGERATVGALQTGAGAFHADLRRGSDRKLIAQAAVSLKG